jgi:hypothetical protein
MITCVRFEQDDRKGLASAVAGYRRRRARVVPGLLAELAAGEQTSR